MNVLFYSPHCGFCVEAVRRVQAIKKQRPELPLVMVSIDSLEAKASMPAFVDRVPLLYSSARQVFVEGKI